MKAILEFILPEESEEHRLAVQGAAWAMVCEAIDGELQNRLSHPPAGSSEEVTKMLEKIRELLHEEINERGLSLK